jgi:hypothetical protein
MVEIHPPLGESQPSFIRPPSLKLLTSFTTQESLGSNEMLLYVAIEPEALDEAIEAAQAPVATLRKKHSMGSGPIQGTMAPAPRIAYSYQVNKLFKKIFWLKSHCHQELSEGGAILSSLLWKHVIIIPELNILSLPLMV